MPRETNIQIRRGTANDWASVNPTLASGEMAIENDTRKVKVGDGTTAWNELRYVGADGGDLEGGGSPSPTATPTPTPTSEGPCNPQCEPGYAVRWAAQFPNTTYEDCVSYQTDMMTPDPASYCCECVFDGG